MSNISISPVAFKIGSIEVMWYGILIGIGMLCAVFIGSKLAKKDPNIYDDAVYDFTMIGIPIGIIGARLYYVIFEWDYYFRHPREIWAIRNGGLGIYGGIIFGLIAAYLFCKAKKIHFLSFADVLIPGVVLAQGIGRWGNFVNQEAHGGPTNVPWAINVDGQMVHPTFLYESILDIGIFIFLYFFVSKKKKFEGQSFYLYLILYGIGRFFIEGLRTDSLYLGSIRISQLVSIVAIVFALFMYYKSRKKQNK